MNVFTNIGWPGTVAIVGIAFAAAWIIVTALKSLGD